MAKQSQGDPDIFANLLFPLSGIDVSRVYDQQPELTTPVGVNVRTYEPITQRSRGGSRAGLSRYIPSLVTGAPAKIQHIAVLVDPQASFLGGGTGTDSTAPNRNLFGGMGGFPPVRHPNDPRRKGTSTRFFDCTFTAQNGQLSASVTVRILVKINGVTMFDSGSFVLAPLGQQQGFQVLQPPPVSPGQSFAAGATNTLLVQYSVSGADGSGSFSMLGGANIDGVPPTYTEYFNVGVLVTNPPSDGTYTNSGTFGL